mmetsp:Transcript_4976/g.7184  ORF Transcript_4976/g.7184 Transcript_4976/m.7184 type:complete len:186 (-) Transcript_4976:140-697(-)|eukprot:CAMPEP_0194213544 /NCGR_PEP_ID=MMETSP0156-20130528/14232_1 /TAXON_ID=33649 /ORGANISM="Thalassionema nitzschioides, Strain L26-B" /LENGTH=185 /DNA_ID=CAMNT_0038941597 /DNA_START=82 /DNA_END=639 /DNA_ORIENTATION=-
MVKAAIFLTAVFCVGFVEGKIPVPSSRHEDRTGMLDSSLFKSPKRKNSHNYDVFLLRHEGRSLRNQNHEDDLPDRDVGSPSPTRAPSSSDDLPEREVGNSPSVPPPTPAPTLAPTLAPTPVSPVPSTPSSTSSPTIQATPSPSRSTNLPTNNNDFNTRGASSVARVFSRDSLFITILSALLLLRI